MCGNNTSVIFYLTQVRNCSYMTQLRAVLILTQMFFQCLRSECSIWKLDIVGVRRMDGGQWGRVGGILFFSYFSPLGEWADPGGTAIPGQPVTKAE